MAGAVRPKSYPIRKATDNEQSAGRIYNQKRYPEHGGLTSAAKLGGDNPFDVEAPTSTRTAEKADRSTD